MQSIDLSTTNLLLGILAAVSVLQALVLIGAGIMGYRMYTQVMSTVQDLETRHVVPLVARVNEIMADVKGVTERVNHQTERVDMALRGTIDRVDETAERVKSNVRDKASRVVGVVYGIRAAIERMLGGSKMSSEPVDGRSVTVERHA